MSRDAAYEHAVSLWGANACIHEELRRNGEGTSVMYSVGTAGDLFNWTAHGQGWSYEEAFAQAGARLPARRNAHLAVVPALTTQETHPL